MPAYDGYYSLHWHQEFEINYVFSGKITLNIDGEDYRLDPGQAAFVNGRSLHSLVLPKTTKGKFCSIVFSEQFLFPSVSDPVYEKYIIPLHEGHKVFPTLISGNTDWEKMILNSIVGCITAYKEKKPGYELKAKIAFLSLMHQYIERDALISVDSKHNSKIDAVRKALLKIHQNYSEDIEIRFLAKEANCSPEHFCRSFKSIVGKSPKEYLTDYRLTRAVRMLQLDEQSITRIASDCGFNDLNYFSRLFKKKNKMTPREYRGMFLGEIVNS
jgi:AraC-like DNA-binding protein